ncbi:MAG: hypothetical protein ACI9CF_000089 [Candidatus Omnitrophota bacterium]|jgi:hypothetical protein
MRKLKTFFILNVLFIGLISIPSETIGIEPVQPTRVLVAPVSFQLPEVSSLNGKNMQVAIHSIDRLGRKHPVTDLRGKAQWEIEATQAGQAFQILPGPNNYAGPLQILVNGKVVDRFSTLIPGSKNLLMEKILTGRAADGAQFKVHYTDFALEKIHDLTYPERVLTSMKSAYKILKQELKVEEWPARSPKAFDVYLGDATNEGLYPFGGFDYTDFKRAPLFVIKKNEETGQKTPAILMPIDYKNFLVFWNKINNVPHDGNYDVDTYLDSSIIHEMTHAFMHVINENLGSTEHQIRNGDWYTEGVARYFETKIGSDPGFASMGFRKKVDDRIQFSRGGANYYLRYPDESFFGLRYENSLFWLYFEHAYGVEKIFDVSQELAKVPFDAAYSDYQNALQKSTGVAFDQMLNNYFNWIYTKGYKAYSAGANLLEVAKTMTVWSNNTFYTYSKHGTLLRKSHELDIDWIAHWGDDKPDDFGSYVAGDWTPKADINPLAFDVHEILVSKDLGSPTHLVIHNQGESKHLWVTLYLEINGKTEVMNYRLGEKGAVDLQAQSYERLTKVGIVLANLDPTNIAEYKIEIK